VSLGLLPQQGRDLILAGAILSILLNPVAFWLVDRYKARAASVSRRRPAGSCSRRAQAAISCRRPMTTRPISVPTAKTGHTILIGYGRVGALVGEALRADGAATGRHRRC
jgi:CPA2 family monovalent cation:H+ antiporter-2